MYIVLQSHFQGEKLNFPGSHILYPKQDWTDTEDQIITITIQVIFIQVVILNLCFEYHSLCSLAALPFTGSYTLLLIILQLEMLIKIWIQIKTFKEVQNAPVVSLHYVNPKVHHFADLHQMARIMNYKLWTVVMISKTISQIIVRFLKSVKGAPCYFAHIHFSCVS